MDENELMTSTWKFIYLWKSKFYEFNNEWVLLLQSTMTLLNDKPIFFVWTVLENKKWSLVYQSDSQPYFKESNLIYQKYEVRYNYYFYNSSDKKILSFIKKEEIDLIEWCIYIQISKKLIKEGKIKKNSLEVYRSKVIQTIKLKNLDFFTTKSQKELKKIKARLKKESYKNIILRISEEFKERRVQSKEELDKFLLELLWIESNENRFYKKIWSQMWSKFYSWIKNLEKKNKWWEKIKEEWEKKEGLKNSDLMIYISEVMSNLLLYFKTTQELPKLQKDEGKVGRTHIEEEWLTRYLLEYLLQKENRTHLIDWGVINLSEAFYKRFPDHRNNKKKWIRIEEIKDTLWIRKWVTMKNEEVFVPEDGMKYILKIKNKDERDKRLSFFNFWYSYTWNEYKRNYILEKISKDVTIIKKRN